MATCQLPDGVRPTSIDTDRLRIHALVAGPDDGVPVVFLHGNLATSLFWDETLDALPDRYRGIAVDMRGFGDTEPKPVDATRGVGDLADDLDAMIETMGLDRPHLVGWSTGGLVAMRFAADDPGRVRSLTLVGSVPPYGFGGTGDTDGTPINDAYSGVGAGIMPEETLTRVGSGDLSSESDFSPRVFMNAFYWKQGFTVDPAREDAFVEAICTTVIGEDNNPGDIVPAEHWPGFGPGTRGTLNALSGRYGNVARLADVEPKPPILWVQGTDDLVVSDTSSYDIGHLGRLGVVPGWPGAAVYPAQPMVAQMRAFLERYRSAGGTTVAVEIEGAGHGPHIDHAPEFQAAFFAFLDQAGS
ncbi:MAG: alpha/beta hydrolase [Acidimicrobiales bacterium]